MSKFKRKLKSGQDQANKDTLELAERICIKRRAEVQNGIYGFCSNEKLKGSFIDYVKKLITKKKEKGETFHNWISLLKYLEKFRPHGVTFQELNRQFVVDFKAYLDKTNAPKSDKKLAPTTKSTYFKTFKAAINQAIKEDILTTDPAKNVEGFKPETPQREFLTRAELQSILKYPCEMPQVKTAFLFSCLTGLRWCDIKKLRWSEVQHSQEMGHYLRFRQQKTKALETLPISIQAFELLGSRKEADAYVFEELKYSAYVNWKLQIWLARAGIDKKITFHCARHTYATLQLTLGTDIYTVSKLLGHRELKTTQVYAKIIDDKKREAANRIQLDF